MAPSPPNPVRPTPMFAGVSVSTPTLVPMGGSEPVPLNQPPHLSQTVPSMSGSTLHRSISTDMGVPMLTSMPVCDFNPI
jgi:hypothetical protein